MNTLETIYAASAYVESRLEGRRPEVGIVLGSGLGKLSDHIEDPIVIPYREIPGFPVSTAIGHKGNFIVGTLGGKCVIAMQGRIHYYEGYPMSQVVLPIRLMKVIGIRTLFVSNAAGATNLSYHVGDLMIIKDHINLIPNPLIGPNLDDFGPRFPDMTRPYDPKLIRRAEEIAEEEGISLHKGVYVACSGPCYETPAEYKYFRQIGADAVGMSVITDVAPASDDAEYVTDGEAIVRAADAAADKMTRLFTRLVESLQFS